MNPKPLHALTTQTTTTATATNHLLLLLLLKKCSCTVPQLKQLHAHLLLTNRFSLSVATLIIKCYLSSGNFHDALRVFRSVPNPDLYLYNIIISNAPPPSSSPISIFKQMLRRGVSPDGFTFNFLFKSCYALRTGCQIHGFLLKSGFSDDAHANNSMMSMYSVNGELNACEKLFSGFNNRDVVTWNTAISSIARSDDPLRVFELLGEMMKEGGVRPNERTMVVLLSVSSRLRRLDLGEWVHECVETEKIQSNLILQTALVDMYAKCAKVEAARRVFDKMSRKNVISWNAMIDGYIENGRQKDAVTMFYRMVKSGIKPNGVTMLLAISACVDLGDLELGHCIFGLIYRLGMSWISLNLANAVIDMYAKCGDIESAVQVFVEMVDRDHISWTSLIGGFVHCGRFDDALKCFQQMILSNAELDEAALVNLLSLSAKLGALGLGRWIHAYIDKEQLESSVRLNTSLVDMYAKCGAIVDAVEVFNESDSKNVMLWTAIISALGMNGRGKQALSVFGKMQQCGVRPDEITLIAVLSACSHAGLVEEGRMCFYKMAEIYDIDHIVEHYSCMVDLLGRAGFVREAWEMVEKMQMRPSVSMLGSLLNSSRSHGEVDMAEEIVDMVCQQSRYAASVAYVSLSNAYAHAKRWNDVEKIREMMHNTDIRKQCGASSIDLNVDVC